MNQSLIEKNEIEVNESLRNISKKLFLLSPIMLLMKVVGIFEVSYGVAFCLMVITAIAASVPQWIGTIVPSEKIKWFVVIDFTIIVMLQYSFAYVNALILFLVPLAIASLYYSRQLIKATIGMVLVGLALGEIVASSQKLKFLSGFEWIPLHMGLYAVQFFVVGILLLQLAKRTFLMLEKSQQLTIEVEEYLQRNIETGKQVEDSVTEVHNHLKQVNQGAEYLEQSVVKISESSKEIVEEAQQANQIVVEIADEISNAMNQTQEMIQNSNELEMTGRKSKENLSIFIQATDEIKEKTDLSRTHMEQLEKKMEEVISTVTLIESISAQTEMLALNASIEAARCGESGKGFAVIAGEVKSLAFETSECNHKIKKLVEEVSQDTQEVVKAIAENYEKVENSVRYIDEAGSSFDLMAQVQQTMSGQIIEITNTVQKFIDQSGAIQEHIRQLLERNEVNAEEIKEIQSAVHEISSSTSLVEHRMQDIQTQVVGLVEQ